MRYKGTAINAAPSRELTNSLREQGYDSLVGVTVLVGVHSCEDVRLDNPDAADERNRGTYFTEVPMALEDVVTQTRGEREVIVYGRTPAGHEVYFKPSGITSRLQFLANGIIEKTRADGTPVVLKQGETLHMFQEPELELAFIVGSETGRAKALQPTLRPSKTTALV